MKRFLALIILAAMALTLCSCGDKNAVTPTDATHKNGAFEYTVMADGTAKITKYSSADKVVTLDIPSVLDKYSVTVIGKGAFAGVQNVTVINAPDRLVKIEDEAFFKSGIMKVFMHTSILTSIGARAFAECPNLVQADMPRTVESIGEMAFASCPLLTVAYFRCDVKNIAGDAFSSCPSVTVYAMDTYTNVIAYCKAHSLNADITESEVTTAFTLSQNQ